MTALAPTLQAFFTDCLTRQRQASAHTIAAYRDTLRLLLAFAAAADRQAPRRGCEIADLDAPLIGAFLDHLENERGNSVRTRNARLAAIHSLFRYAALRHPEHAAVIQRVLAIPPKRFDRKLVTYLTEPEIAALLAAPDRATWTGRRDHAHAAARHPDRAAGLRAHLPHQCTTSPGHRSPRQLPGKGPQTADNPAHPGHRHGAARLARRARRRNPATPCSPPAPAPR